MAAAGLGADPVNDRPPRRRGIPDIGDPPASCGGDDDNDGDDSNGSGSGPGCFGSCTFREFFVVLCIIAVAFVGIMGAHPRAGARVPDINVTVQQLYWSRILWATRTDGIFGRPALYPALQELQASCNDTRKPVNDLVSAWNGYQTLTGRGNEGAVRSIRGISRQIWHRYDPERADRLANAQICKAASDARNAIPFVAEAAQALHTSVSSVSLSLEAVAKATYLWFDRDNIGTPDTKRLAKWAYQAMTASGLADYRQTLFDQADVNGKRQMMAVYMDVATASLSMHQSYGVQVARKCGEMDEAAQTEPEARDGVAVLHGRFTAGLSAEEVVADMDTWGVQMTEVTLNGLR